MTELETLKAKLAAREGVLGYAENLQQIRDRIAELEAAGAAQESVNDDE